MDEKGEKEHILQALESMGLDVYTERFKAEIYHLTTLFEQGQTLTETLRTVNDLSLRSQLKPVLYLVTLHALLIALNRLQAITTEQLHDFEDFLCAATRCCPGQRIVLDSE